MTIKRYDRAYFDRWYRDRRHAIGTRADLAREVAFAVAAAERVIGRPVRSVLDVGAGEGRWQPVIHRLRPRARYAGVDSSEWAVRQWGRRRNLRLGAIEHLDVMGLDGPFDLVVAADILHYLEMPVLRRAAAQLEPLIGGVAYMPLFTARDASDGDHQGFQERSARDYRTVLGRHGIIPIGMHLWTTTARWDELSDFERGST
jgi:2-polyprenyl-3-methyl-5-hydroxy-6-metoxy-1,4-benzoquinol methylase